MSHIMTPGAFSAMLRACEPGESFVYFVGHLARGGLPVRDLAAAAWQAYENGNGMLVQRRTGAAFCEYLFVKKAERTRP